jgi:hypothetical protein
MNVNVTVTVNVNVTGMYARSKCLNATPYSALGAS